VKQSSILLQPTEHFGSSQSRSVNNAKANPTAKIIDKHDTKNNVDDKKNVKTSRTTEKSDDKDKDEE